MVAASDEDGVIWRYLLACFCNQRSGELIYITGKGKMMMMSQDGVGNISIPKA